MEPAPAPVAERTSFGRYEVVHPLAAGGMGTVYLGRMRAARGVSLTVAIKRIHATLAGDPHILGMFLDEARITSLVRHPNVVQTLDVVEEGGELLLVMEYVHGVSLAHLLTQARAHGERLPLAVTSRIASDVLYGLHAAHETTNEQGKSLEIVHRDVSPQNVIVGVDGISRVLDFGIARAANRVETTQLGEIKGKLRYIAPEQFGREAVDRRADVYGVGLVLWEMIAGTAMRRASSPGGLTSAILRPRTEPPSSFVPDVPPALDDLVLRALANEPRERFAFAQQMAVALEAAVTPAPYARVAEVVRELAHEEITERKALLERAASSSGHIPMMTPSSASAVVGPVSSVRDVEPGPPPAAASPVEPVTTRSGRRRRFVTWSVGGVAVAAAALAIGWPSHPKEASVPAAPPPPVASVEPVPPPEPPASAAPAPSPAPDTPATTVRSTHSRKPPRWVPRPAPAKPDCSIPYVVDAHGIRVPRRECM